MTAYPDRPLRGHAFTKDGELFVYDGSQWVATIPCFCGAPAVDWTYSVMGDGQTINGLAVCGLHQQEQL